MWHVALHPLHPGINLKLGYSPSDDFYSLLYNEAAFHLRSTRFQIKKPGIACMEPLSAASPDVLGHVSSSDSGIFNKGASCLAVGVAAMVSHANVLRSTFWW